MPAIRTLLVDDSSEFLEAAENFLSADPLIEIIGSAFSGQEALDKVRLLNPDLVLMDLAMPEMSGLEATRQIKSQAGPPRVIILTLHDNLEYRMASKSVQADGFVSKSDFGVELLPQIYSLFEEKQVT